jgi:hypothetical protein
MMDRLSIEKEQDGAQQLIHGREDTVSAKISYL